MRKTTAPPAGPGSVTSGGSSGPGSGSVISGEGSAQGSGSVISGEGSAQGSGPVTSGQGSAQGSGPVASGQGSAPGSGRVIPGAGPAPRPGERATVRLRAGGPEEAPSRHAPQEPSAHAPQEPSGHAPEGPSRYAPEWLRLREAADAAARATELLERLRTRLADRADPHGGLVVHDLGCGTGSMGRWLAPRLDGAQHWILHDRDPYLLHFAAVGAAGAAADGSRITVETRRGDIARLTPDALAGASLVTASALLDVLTREEVDALAAACAGAGCPALLTLSVAGRVELTPGDPLDAEVTEAFNAHQRRTGLLGPDAVTAAREAFAAHGAGVRVCPSPWRLGPDRRELTAQWLRGWVGAAVEQRPELRTRADRFLAERLEACAAGELRVVVHHSDLLALPGLTGGAA